MSVWQGGMKGFLERETDARQALKNSSVAVGRNGRDGRLLILRALLY